VTLREVAGRENIGRTATVLRAAAVGAFIDTLVIDEEHAKADIVYGGEWTEWKVYVVRKKVLDTDTTCRRAEVFV